MNETTTIKAYKGFDKNMKCRGIQYEVGQTYHKEGLVKVCESGFHACENPLDIWIYYGPCDSVFAAVEVSGTVSRTSEDSKIAAATLTVKEKLTLGDFISASVKWILNACKDKMQVATSGYSKRAASGYNSQLAASGYNSQLAASGDNSQLAASGDNSKLAASGYNSQLAASGDNSKLAASGDNSKLAASGDNSKLAASGYNSKLAASGSHSVAAAIGPESIASAGPGGWIVLAYYGDGKPTHVRAGKIGVDGLKPNTPYRLNEKGEFVEN